ncbi:MAG: hypothetical protein HYR73_09815 [Candidatus Eisenbacteria bacterium]|nr:hypothetical protein [Candidatus Eisenbacteria bacterium]
MRVRPILVALAWAIAPAAALGVLVAAAALAQRYVPGADSTRPRLKYADSLTSINDRCIVTHNQLNPRIDPVYVNGVPVGFC